MNVHQSRTTQGYLAVETCCRSCCRSIRLPYPGFDREKEIDGSRWRNLEKQGRRNGGLSPVVKWKYVSGSRWQPKSGCGSVLISMRKLCYLFEHVQLCMRNMLTVFKGAGRAAGKRVVKGGTEGRIVCRITSEKRKRQSYWKGAPSSGRNWNNNKAWTRNNESTVSGLRLFPSRLPFPTPAANNALVMKWKLQKIRDN